MMIQIDNRSLAPPDVPHRNQSGEEQADGPQAESPLSKICFHSVLCRGFGNQQPTGLSRVCNGDQRSTKIASIRLQAPE